ncbi:unnamed protein product, partial [Polarella glacialis]
GKGKGAQPAQDAPEEPTPLFFGGKGQGGGGGGGFDLKNKDPPPLYDGTDPGRTCKRWLREWKIWSSETDFPEKSWGTKLLRELKGDAKEAIDSLEVDDIVGPAGHLNILAKLDETFKPHMEKTMPRAFETAIYGKYRTREESFLKYISRVKAQFKDSSDEGVNLGENAEGYILFRFAQLEESDRNKLETWTEGCYDFNIVSKALLKLDKVQVKPRGPKQYYQEDFYEYEPDDGNVFYEGEDCDDYDAEQDEDENFVYMTLDEMKDTYTEEEINEIFASYQEMRKNIADKKLGRGFFQLKTGGGGKGKDKGFKGGKFKGKGGNGKGKGGDKDKDKEKMRVHVELLKLRTKCVRCGQVGHWAKECQNRADSRGATTTTTSSPGFTGLSVSTTPIGSSPADFFYSGGDAKVIGVVEIPLGLAGANGLVEFTVVSNDVPALLPVSLLRRLRSSIDLEHMSMHIKTLNAITGQTTSKSIKMNSYPTVQMYFLYRSRFQSKRWRASSRGRVNSTANLLHPCELSRSRASTWGRWRGVLDKVFMALDYAKLAEHLRCWQPLLPLPQPAAGLGSTKAKLTPSARLIEIANAIGGKPLPPMKSSKPATEDPATCAHPATSCRIFANGTTKRSVACQLCRCRWESHGETAAASASSTQAPAPEAKAKARPQAPPGQPVPVCQCKLAGKMFRVNKPGPTLGRHFYKCPRHVCKWFAWDPTEVETLLQEHIRTQAPQGAGYMTGEQTRQYEVYQEQVCEVLPVWNPGDEVSAAFVSCQSFVNETFFEDQEMVFETASQSAHALPRRDRQIRLQIVSSKGKVIEDKSLVKHNLDVTKLLLRRRGDVGATFRLWRSDERMSENFPAMDSGDEEEPEVPDVQEEAGEDEADAGDLSQSEIAMITKLRQNMGHPRTDQFLRALKLGKAKAKFIKYVRTGFKCDICVAKTFPSQKRPMLNIVDFGASFQLTTFVEDKRPETVWKAFSQTWLKIFGPSMIMIVDGGKEFASLFVERASAAGMLIYLTGAKSPWQNGKTERHGAIFKMHLQVARETFEPENDEELEIMADECVAAKNRLSNRSGFSPIQRQIGHSPRLPANITSDDVLEPELAASAAMSRSLQMQRVAMETFLRCDAQDRMMRAARSRNRLWVEFVPAELVYVWRVPRVRKTRGVQRELAPRVSKARWVGPGTVIIAEGANVWISMQGELWKASREQLRHATNTEVQAEDMMSGEYQNLRDELYRKAKTTYKDVDVSGEQAPDAEGDVEFPEQDGRAQDADEEPASEADDGGRVPAGEPLPERCSTGRDVRPRLTAPAEVPLLPAPVDDDDLSDVELEPPAPLSDTLPQAAHPAEEVQRSISMANRLDGIRAEPMRHPARNEGRFEPYFQDDGGTYFFYLADEISGDDILCETFLSADEVKENTITDWKAWTASDTKEWTRVEATGAVILHDVATSRKIRKQLEKDGKLDRIIPSRVVRRMKPGDQPGEPATEKSRWCVGGHKDPDYMSLERHSPSASEEELMVVLQAGASHQMPGYVIDLQNAFMQSDKLEREAGTLYAKPPAGVGLPGVDSEQLIEIKAGVYGLGDASRDWRNSLIPELEKLGYIKSKLAPTTLRLHSDSGQLQGLIVVEIDDLSTVGHEEHKARLDQLSKRFKFGKYRSIHGDSDGTSFNGRRIRQKLDYGFEVDMSKFVKERLSTVKFAKGRKSTPGALANASEISQGRSVEGGLQWAARIGRPDAAGPASIIAGTFPAPLIQDLIDLNKAVEALQKRPDLNLKIHPIPLCDLRLGCVSDASFANAAENRSQGSQGVIAYHKDLVKGKTAQCSLLRWRSGKIQQVVNSTLAAETRSLSTAVAQLTWHLCMLHDVCYGNFSLKDWRSELQPNGADMFIKNTADTKLKEAICIVDAKSLFDHLARETVGGADKRNAIEIQIIRENLSDIAAGVRWVPHQQMIVGALTKRQGNLDALYQLLDGGALQITEESSEMQKRAIGRAAGIILKR